MSQPPSPRIPSSSIDFNSSPSHPHHSTPPPHSPVPRSVSRQSSTSSIHSVKRKPVPTEFDQLKQIGNELIGNGNNGNQEQDDTREREEVLKGSADTTTSNRPNFLPRGFEPPNQASTSTYPPSSSSPPPLSRHNSSRSRPLSPPLPSTLAHQNLSHHDRTQTQTSPTPSLPASSIAEQSIFGSPPVGTIGVDKPREVIRIERDYSSGTGIAQFWAGWIWELEGRVSPTEYQTILNDLNTILAEAHDPFKSVVDNTMAVLTLWLSPYLKKSHYEKEMDKFDQCLVRVNKEILNGKGLNLLSPKKNAWLF
ncbi:hypothetical protein JCM5353_007411, partial [Sporobolomyces roseus]